MAFTDLKISIEKSWGFTRQVAILIILGIVVISGFLMIHYFFIKEAIPETPKPLPAQERTMEEIIKDLTVPEENRETEEEFPPEIIKDLTVPK